MHDVSRSRAPLAILLCLALAACPAKQAQASPPIMTAASLSVVGVDSFKVRATCRLAQASDSLFTVACRSTFADSTTGASLGTVPDVPIGGIAQLIVVRSLAPGQRFVVSIAGQGVNQDGGLGPMSAPIFPFYRAPVGQPGVLFYVTPSICRIGDPGC